MDNKIEAAEMLEVEVDEAIDKANGAIEKTEVAIANTKASIDKIYDELSAPSRKISTEKITAFSSSNAFEQAQRMAQLLAKSQLVPKEYQGNIANAVIALEIAQRVNASPLAVMQNLYIVHGKPGWSAQFIIASLNSCGKFSPLRFDLDMASENWSCIAYAIEKDTGEILRGPMVDLHMAKSEGWSTKNGSKWKTMPELMLRYRSASFFGKLYAPEILMGMQTAEELHDIIDGEVVNAPNVSDLNAQIAGNLRPKNTGEFIGDHNIDKYGKESPGFTVTKD